MPEPKHLTPLQQKLVGAVLAVAAVVAALVATPEGKPKECPPCRCGQSADAGP